MKPPHPSPTKKTHEEQPHEKKNKNRGGEQEAGRAQMQTEEARIRQAAGLLRNSALTFTGQAATGDENLCTLSLCIIGLERRAVCAAMCARVAVRVRQRLQTFVCGGTAA